jgi:hypothetical protein
MMDARVKPAHDDECVKSTRNRYRVSAAAIAGFTSANPMVDDAAVEFMSITAIVKG